MKTLRIAAGGLVVLILQISLSQILTFFDARPDLLLIYLLHVTLRHGRYAGLLTGFCLGLAQDALSLGTLGVIALLKCNIGFWMGVWFEGRVSALSTGWWMVFLSFAALFQNFIAGLFYVGGTAYSDYVLWVVIPTTVYTCLLGLLWALAPTGERSTPMIGSSSRVKRESRLID